MHTCAANQKARESVDREKLFNDNITWAYGIAEKIARTLPPSFDVADLKQEAILKLWQEAQRYDPGFTDGKTYDPKNNKFQGYAYLAVRGSILMACRRKHYLAATAEEIDQDAVYGEPTPAEALENQRDRANRERRQTRRRRMIEVRLREFPPAAYLEEFLVRRVYLDGVDVAEIARSMEQPKSLIKRRLAAGVRMLKRNGK